MSSSQGVVGPGEKAVKNSPLFFSVLKFHLNSLCTMSVVDIRVRNSKKVEKYFNYSAIPFPDASEILSDQIMEQMMMDGSVFLSILTGGTVVAW
jgi:hypothetical protein